MESGLKKQILGIVADLLEEDGLLMPEEKNCIKNRIDKLEKDGGNRGESWDLQ